MTAKPNIGRGGAGLPLSGAFLGAMVALYIGERLFADTPMLRTGLAALALLLFLVAIVGRVARLGKLASATACTVERRILLTYVIGIVSVLLYGAQTDFVMDLLRTLFDTPQSADRYQTILAAAWMMLWLCSVVPLLFIEISYVDMDTNKTVELRRINRSLNSGIVVAMTAVTLFFFNYVARELNEKADLSYFKTTKPSESSKKMVANLTDRFEVVLFFANGNEVLDQAQAYFEELGQASKLFSVRQLDQVLEPKLAKKLGASDNGTVIFSKGNRHHPLVLGARLSRAKSKLKKLDSEFQNAFMKLASSRKVAYLTVGHEERAQKESERKSAEDIKGLRKVLKRLNYSVKDLGIAQGLGRSIPPDATVVIIVGPRQSFAEEELTALHTYLQSGGRALFFLDPVADLNINALLKQFGLEFHAEPLAVQRPLARQSYTKADRQIIVSNRFGSHESIKTLSRLDGQAAVVMSKAGYLTKVPQNKGIRTKTRFTIHNLGKTWNDANDNFEFDRDAGEKTSNYQLAAAVTKEVATSKPQAKPNQMRLVVVADADIASDGLLLRRDVGNLYMVLDALKWLGGEEKFTGEISSEEDIKISHSDDKDQVWFYLTIVGIPALVLGFGLFYTRRRRKRR